MSDRKIEVSINIGGEWKPLNHIDSVYVGEPESRKIISETTKEINHQLEFYKKLAEHANQTGSRITIIGGRLSGKLEYRRLLQMLEHEFGNPTPPDQNSAFSFRPRRCDCLKCRMGKSDQCMTFSPKKHRGK